MSSPHLRYYLRRNKDSLGLDSIVSTMAIWVEQFDPDFVRWIEQGEKITLVPPPFMTKGATND